MVKSLMKRLTSLTLMLVFTSSGLVVLAASVVLMTVELLFSLRSPQSSTPKTENSKKSAFEAELMSEEVQVYSRG